MTYDQWKTTEPFDTEPPLQIFTCEACEACDGKGYTVHRITVYEAGCGFPHDDTDERPCEHCGGFGEFVDDAEPDAPV